MPKLFKIALIACIFAIFASLSPSKKNQTFSVFSWNLRYNNPADGENAWHNRKDLVASKIISSNPDIAGFQEVLNDQFLFLQQKLTNYRSFGLGRDDGKTKGEYSPIFWKSTYTLLDSGMFWLSETPQKPSMGWDAVCFRICTWVKLKTPSGKNIFVFNAHLDHIGVNARNNGCKLIKQYMDSLAHNQPVLLTGDFNAGPDDASVATIKSTLNDSRDVIQGEEKDLYTFCTFDVNGNHSVRIDYIFSSKQLNTKSYEILRSKRDESHYLSDHFAVMASFRLN